MDIMFHKMHGTLNDFVVFHDLEGKVNLSTAQIAHVCHRQAGVGADGLIAVRPSDKADFFMDYYNSDGSAAEMCGNGTRCLAKYVYDNELTRKTELLVETRGGVKQLRLFLGHEGTVAQVQVDMGVPVFDPERIPVTVSDTAVPVLDYPLRVQGEEFRCSMVSMGNPHCVIFPEQDVEEMPRLFGPEIEHNSLFPARTNVEFIQVLDRKRIRMRVWERGSGETWSCGTGACAAAVVSRLKDLVDEDVRVELKGGALQVEWKGPGSSVLMTGPAVVSFVGSVTV
jgi:diaminopimelate epimerase